jgi:hypothetical protein
LETGGVMHWLVGLLIYAAWGVQKLIETIWDSHKEWKSKWRSLQKGWNLEAARKLIREPKTVQVDGDTIIWRYPLGGRLVFSADKLVAWTEPK